MKGETANWPRHSLAVRWLLTDERSTADANCADADRPISAAPARHAATFRNRGDTIECVSSDIAFSDDAACDDRSGVPSQERRASCSSPNPRDAMSGHPIPVWLGRTEHPAGPDHLMAADLVPRCCLTMAEGD